DSDEERRDVVVVALLAQAEPLVRAMDEPVPTRRNVRKVELLSVEERGIPVRVPDGRALFDKSRARVELAARAEEARRAVPHSGRDPVVVRDAEAALAVADDELEVTRSPELVVLEAEQMPVVVRRRNRVVEMARRANDPHAAVLEVDELRHVHRRRPGRTNAADPE